MSVLGALWVPMFFFSFLLPASRLSMTLAACSLTHWEQYGPKSLLLSAVQAQWHLHLILVFVLVEVGILMAMLRLRDEAG